MLGAFENVIGWRQCGAPQRGLPTTSQRYLNTCYTRFIYCTVGIYLSVALARAGMRRATLLHVRTFGCWLTP